MDEITADKFLADFSDRLANRKLADSSLKTYRSILNEFGKYIESRNSDAKLRTEVLPLLIYDYIEHLQIKNLHPHSINRVIFVLKLLNKELHLPCALSKNLPPQQRDLRVLTEGEWLLLQKAVDNSLNKRDACILRLILDTGIKPQECCKLELDDLNFAEEIRSIRIAGRSGTREIPMLARLETHLRLWLIERQKDHPDSMETALFLSKQGKRLSPYALDQIIRKTGIKLHFNLCAQTIRNTLLQRMSKAGTPIEIVSLIAGQKSWRYTQRFYLGPDSTQNSAASLTREQLHLAVNKAATSPGLCPSP